MKMHDLHLNSHGQTEHYTLEMDIRVKICDYKEYSFIDKSVESSIWC